MFKEVRLESQKELFLKLNHPSRNQRYTLRKQKPLTDKITNLTSTTVYHPQNKEIFTRQQYLNNILKNSYKPYKDKNDSRKLNKIQRSRNIQSQTFLDINSSISGSQNSHNFRSFSKFNKCKTEYKKRSKSYCSISTFDRENILRTTNNSRLRKLYSMTSDIFNLGDSSTNLVNDNNQSVSNNNSNTGGFIQNIHLGNENNHKYKNLKYFTFDNEDYNNSNIMLSKALLGKGNNEFKNLKDKNKNIDGIKNIKKNFENKKYHKKSLLLNKDFSNTDFVPFLHKIKTKTNASNIESVNYDIISNKANNLYDNYKKLSNQKVNNEKYEKYEIIIPKNYNKFESTKLKNLLHAQGVHFFEFREQAKVAGDKGKFEFKIRTTNYDKNNKNNNIMEKLSNKLIKNFNIKLKLSNEAIERKTTEITREYGPEVVTNHLQSEDMINKPFKR